MLTAARTDRFIVEAFLLFQVFLCLLFVIVLFSFLQHYCMISSIQAFLSIEQVFPQVNLKYWRLIAL